MPCEVHAIQIVGAPGRGSQISPHIIVLEKFTHLHPGSPPIKWPFQSWLVSIALSDIISQLGKVLGVIPIESTFFRSPVKGVFKIPELPKKYNDMEVFSQYVEEDNYEMVLYFYHKIVWYNNYMNRNKNTYNIYFCLQDSFCVDSHIGLTQANEISELELAEIVLEEKRRKKKSKSQTNPVVENDDSPVVRRKNKKARQIHSDSDESS